jgi:hypothetical protein
MGSFGYLKKSAKKFLMKIYRISPLTTLALKHFRGYRQKKIHCSYGKTSLVLLAYTNTDRLIRKKIQNRVFFLGYVDSISQYFPIIIRPKSRF